MDQTSIPGQEAEWLPGRFKQFFVQLRLAPAPGPPFGQASFGAFCHGPNSPGGGMLPHSVFALCKFFFFLRFYSLGQPWWRSGLAPPAAWGVILGTLDRVPHRAPYMEPASPSACSSAPLSLCVSL